MKKNSKFNRATFAKWLAIGICIGLFIVFGIRENYLLMFIACCPIIGLTR